MLAQRGSEWPREAFLQASCSCGVKFDLADLAFSVAAGHRRTGKKRQNLIVDDRAWIGFNERFCNFFADDLGSRIARGGKNRKALLQIVGIGGENMHGLTFEQPLGRAAGGLAPETG